MRTVLIVDDDVRVTRAVARNLLCGYRRVEVAHDPATAVTLAKHSRPDLIIVDLKLGDASGIDAIRTLKSEVPESVVALVSGYISTDITVMAVKAGADIVMAKPITGNDLLRRIGEGMHYDAGSPDTPSLAQVEAEHIARVLRDCDGNVSEAARRLGIYRTSLQRKLRKREPSEPDDPDDDQ